MTALFLTGMPGTGEEDRFKNIPKCPSSTKPALSPNWCTRTCCNLYQNLKKKKEKEKKTMVSVIPKEPHFPIAPKFQPTSKMGIA